MSCARLDNREGLRGWDTSLGCQKPLQASPLLHCYLLSPASDLATEQQAELGPSPVFSEKASHCLGRDNFFKIFNKVFLGRERNLLQACGELRHCSTAKRPL